MHLFDIDIPGGIRFQESEVLTPGEDFFTFDTGNVVYWMLVHLKEVLYFSYCV